MLRPSTKRYVNRAHPLCVHVAAIRRIASIGGGRLEKYVREVVMGAIELGSPFWIVPIFVRYRTYFSRAVLPQL